MTRDPVIIGCAMLSLLLILNMVFEAHLAREAEACMFIRSVDFPVAR